VFAIIYGAANGVMTIVRGLAIPEMVTKRSYGELKGLLALPAPSHGRLLPSPPRRCGRWMRRMVLC
jgi:hypothetical protein